MFKPQIDIVQRLIWSGVLCMEDASIFDGFYPWVLLDLVEASDG